MTIQNANFFLVSYLYEINHFEFYNVIFHFDFLILHYI
jgi:hypothetical protein